MLSGIVVPVITPFDADGALDAPTFRFLIDFYPRAGIQGLFVLGSSGQGPAMSAAERERAAEIVLERTAGRLPVVVHVGTADIPTTVALAEHAARHGADGIGIIPFYYYRDAPEAAIRAHFRAVGGAVPLPLPIYENPEYSGISISLRPHARLRAAVSGRRLGAQRQRRHLRPRALWRCRDDQPADELRPRTLRGALAGGRCAGLRSGRRASGTGEQGGADRDRCDRAVRAGRGGVPAARHPGDPVPALGRRPLAGRGPGGARVVVTGGSGTLGAAAVKALRDAGYAPLVIHAQLDRRQRGRAPPGGSDSTAASSSTRKNQSRNRS